MVFLRNLANLYLKRKFLGTKNDLKQIIRMKSVLVDNINGIMTIGVNRPTKKNAIDTETCLHLREAIEDFENNNEAPICVLHGIGGNFCSGFDISEFDNEKFTIPQIFTKGTFFKKPVIAAIDGYAVAAGFELALMCDLRIMEENAKIGFLSRRFGIPIMNEGTVRIQKMIGISRAMDLVLTGRLLDTKEAFEWGIVNRTVAVGTAFGQAINLAISLQKFPQECMLHDRDSLYFTSYDAKDFQEACEFERTNISQHLEKENLKNINRKFKSGIGKHGKFHNLTTIK